MFYSIWYSLKYELIFGKVIILITYLKTLSFFSQLAGYLFKGGGPACSSQLSG